MTCAQGLLRLLWGGARSWSATGLGVKLIEKRRTEELMRLLGLEDTVLWMDR